MIITRQSKREQLKNQIMLTAAEQFRLHGIKAVKMDDIAALLKISKRTLYEVYENKRDLLFDVLMHISSVRYKQMEDYAKTTDNVIDCLIEYFRIQTEAHSVTNPQFFKDLQKYPELLDRAQYVDDTYKAKVDGFFARGIEEGYFLPQVDFELLLNIIKSSMQVVRDNQKYADVEMKDVFFSYICVIIRGVCTQKGLVKLDEFLSRLNA